MFTLLITHTEYVLEGYLSPSLPAVLLTTYCIQSTRRVYQVWGTAQILLGLTRQNTCETLWWVQYIKCAW